MKRYRNYEGGDGEPEAADPPAEDNPDAEKGEEDPLVDTEAEEAEKAKRIREIEIEMCCCCICHCQGEEDKPYSCCGCFPLKCGILFIGIATIFITIFLFCEVYWTLLNEYIHWWYVLVATLLLIPIVVAVVFVIRFFAKDQKASRTNMWVAMILAIVSFTLLALWNLCYFQWVYKYDVVYAGVDGFGYV